MKLINTLVMTLHTLIFLLIGVVLIVLSLRIVSPIELSAVMGYFLQSSGLRLATGGFGLLLIVATLSILQLSLVKIQREKTIAFANPHGQVTVSLSAIEDFVKRLTCQIPEIKELKPRVVAGKRGIEIAIRVALASDTNIPEITEKVQTLVKSGVQDMLGIEETITAKVHVAKIVVKEEAVSEERQVEPRVPFRYGK